MSPATSAAARVIETRLLEPTPDGIAQAASLLCAGQLVAFPTETVYGLGADATDPVAVARIFAAKGRPTFNPLIAHVSDFAAARRLGVFSPLAAGLAEAFWPGPLTLVVPARPDCPVCDLARAGLDTIAIRVPAHPVAHRLITMAGRPIAAPSANRSGHISPSRAEHVQQDLSGLIEAILDGGTCMIGLESTILGCFGDELVLLRPGGITREAIAGATGRIVSETSALEEDGAPLAPGRLSSHYAPATPLRLDARQIGPGEACLAFGLPLPPGAVSERSLNLSASGDLTEAAAHLYDYLRALDALGASGIGVVALPRAGIGEAILDRLTRAAAPSVKVVNYV